MSPSVTLSVLVPKVGKVSLLEVLTMLLPLKNLLIIHHIVLELYCAHTCRGTDGQGPAWLHEHIHVVKVLFLILREESIVLGYFGLTHQVFRVFSAVNTCTCSYEI